MTAKYPLAPPCPTDEYNTATINMLSSTGTALPGSKMNVKSEIRILNIVS